MHTDSGDSPLSPDDHLFLENQLLSKKRSVAHPILVYKMHTDSGDSPLSPDGHLLLEEDPMLWILKNPTSLLSVRSLKLDYSRYEGEGIIGDSIGELTELTHLSIHNVNTITCLPNTCTTLNNLEMLECHKLEELPPNLGDLQSLASLSIRTCTSLKSLPDSLAKLSKLTELYISGCDQLQELPSNLGDLESLASLSISYCFRLRALPDSLANLSKLTKLNIRSCLNLKALPSNFGDLESLTHFQLDHCISIKSLPSSVAKLSKLTTLMMERCDGLKELPANIGELESLTDFTLYNCSSIKSLPDSVAMLSKLTTLMMKRCDGLEQLPAKIGDLESLTNFTLYDCSSIKSLPDSVAKLSNLTTLNIPYCGNLQNLPANFGQLKSLTHFCIQNCRSLKECPSNLNVVDLSLIGCCSIQSLPRGLSNLKHLVLSLCGNTGEERLANLKYIASLCHLKFQECYLCRSYVKELPENLDKLPQLSVLDIEETRIKCLPSSIAKLSKLRLLLLPHDFILETLPYHFDESIVITVKDKHVRKTWKELREEMEISSFTTITGSPSGYLRLTGDPRPWIKNNYDLLSDVRILDWELGNDLSENITDSIAKLAELTHLYISGGYLSLLFLRFSRITHISLYDCEFKCDMKSIFDGLGKLSTLKYFHLDNLYGTTLPEHMDLPVSLKHLSLRFGGITFMPLLDSLTKLSNLKALHLSQAIQFDSLPRNLDLEKLKLVDCDMTNINSLPRGLRHVEILHTKGMCNSKCDKLEMCLNQFVDVETLSVTCHCIKLLPSLAGLHNLQELQLKDCFSFKKLPLNLDKMVNLVTLNISGTRVKSLPCSISNLPKLQRLILPKCFQPENLPLEFRDRAVFDDTDDKYYENAGYYFYDHETSSEDDDNTTNTIEGVNKVVLEESEDGIISQQQTSPHQLLNQSDPTPVLGDYNFDGRDNNPINKNSLHSIYHSRKQEEIFHFGESSQHDLQNVQMPENMTCVNEEVLNDIEEGIIAEKRTLIRQLLNLPDALPASNTSFRSELIGVNSDNAISHSQSTSLPKAKLINSRDPGTERAINKDIYKKIEINSESEGKKDKRKRKEITVEEIRRLFGRKEKDAAIVLGVKLSTLKRRCRELGIKKWPSSRMSGNDCTNKRKASSNSPSKIEYSQHLVECLDGVNQHVFSNPVPDHVPFGSDVVDNSTLVATQRRRDSYRRVQQHLDGTNLGTSSTTVQPNECSRTIVVKATYKDDQVKVHFSLSSDVELLKEKIGKKLKLEVDKFKMKYQDEDKDLLLVADISDLEDALRVSESSGSNVVRLSIDEA